VVKVVLKENVQNVVPLVNMEILLLLAFLQVRRFEYVLQLNIYLGIYVEVDVLFGKEASEDDQGG